MSGKYTFTKGLKELRFLHCQTSEHSNAVRYERAFQCDILASESVQVGTSKAVLIVCCGVGRS